MASLTKDFVKEDLDFVSRWKAVDFGKSPNFSLNGRKLTIGKVKLKSILKAHLEKKIEEWRKREQAKNDKKGGALEIAKMRIQCAWVDLPNSKLSKFKVILWRKKQSHGSPTDPKIPPGQKPPNP